VRGLLGLGIEKVTAVAVALAERTVVFLETIVQISNLEEDVGLAEEVVDLIAEHLVQPQSWGCRSTQRCTACPRCAFIKVICQFDIAAGFPKITQ
jgi:hypothetical protein